MTEFVNIPVPVERVQEVYELLARKKRDVTTSDNMHEGEFDPHAESGEWTNELLDLMVAESSASMRSILGALGDHSPTWMSTSEIAEETGLRPRQVAAALGPFEKRVRGRYGMKTWPFESREFPGEDCYRFSMPKENGLRVVARLLALKESEGHRK